MQQEPDQLVQVFSDLLLVGIADDEARADIEIAARGKFIVHIENKIWSEEGEDQTHRE